MIITKHAYDRGKVRMGLNKKAFRRLAERALNEGHEHKDANGQLRKYLNMKQKEKVLRKIQKNKTFEK